MPTTDGRRPTLGIVGGGIAGLGAADALRDDFDVTIFERARELGGHLHPVAVTDPAGQRHMLDTAFLGIQPISYPLVTRLFKELGVDTTPIEVDILLWDRARDRCYRFAEFLSLCGTMFDRGAASDVRRLLKTFTEINGDEAHFDRRPARIDEYLQHERCHPDAIDYLLIPAMAIVWGAQQAQARRLSARAAVAMLQQFSYHGADAGCFRPVPSSRAYLDALIARARPRHTLVDTTVHEVVEHGQGVRISSSRGPYDFDCVLIAAPAPDALRMLREPTDDQRRTLSAIDYQKTVAVLHRDQRLRPADRPPVMFSITSDQHASGEPFWITTWDLALVHDVPSVAPCLLSLGDDRLLASDVIRPDCIEQVFAYSHIALTPATAAAQKQTPALNQRGRLYFSGSYFGWTGDHEAAYASALAASDCLRRRIRASAA